MHFVRTRCFGPPTHVELAARSSGLDRYGTCTLGSRLGGSDAPNVSVFAARINISMRVRSWKFGKNSLIAIDVAALLFTSLAEDPELRGIT